MKKIFLFLSLVLLLGCQNQPKLKSFNNVITADDSLNIELSKADILTYHSDKLGLDITYPSYLRHQFLEDDQMEVFPSFLKLVMTTAFIPVRTVISNTTLKSSTTPLE